MDIPSSHPASVITDPRMGPFLKLHQSLSETVTEVISLQSDFATVEYRILSDVTSGDDNAAKLRRNWRSA
jgi:hypothetical protein